VKTKNYEAHDNVIFHPPDTSSF